MKGFCIYALTDGVYLKSLPYGGTGDTDFHEEVKEELDSLGLDGIEPERIVEALKNGHGDDFKLLDEPPADFPGRCWVEMTGDEAILTLIPPLGEGRSVEMPDITAELKAAGADGLHVLEDELESHFKEYTESKEQAAFKVAEQCKYEILVEAAPDGLEAYLTLKGQESALCVTVDDIKHAAEEAKVTHGLLEDKLTEIVENGEPVEKVVIAEGKLPENGNDGFVEYTFDALHEKIGPRIKAKDLADYKDLGIFESVNAGDVLGKLVQPTEGIEGINVHGDPIKPVPGKPATLAPGKNVNIDSDGTALVAVLNGQPILVGGKVSVEELLTIREDVDVSTGSIDYVGSIDIHGAVQAGFTVKAGGDVTCTDVVEGAEIDAQGNVVLKWGFKGQNKGLIRAGGNVMAKFIEAAEVIAGGSIIVEDFILHSDVRAGEEIICESKKGWIAGGHITAGKEVRCKILGSEMAVKTTIDVGIDPAIRTELAEIKKRLNEISPKLTVMLSTYKQMKEMNDKNALPGSKTHMFDDLVKNIKPLKEEFERSRARAEEIRAMIEAGHKGKIIVTDTSHQGITVTIGSVSRPISDSFRKVSFTSDGEEIIISEANA